MEFKDIYKCNFQYFSKMQHKNKISDLLIVIFIYLTKVQRKDFQ